MDNLSSVSDFHVNDEANGCQQKGTNSKHNHFICQNALAHGAKNLPRLADVVVCRQIHPEQCNTYQQWLLHAQQPGAVSNIEAVSSNKQQGACWSSKGCHACSIVICHNNMTQARPSLQPLHQPSRHYLPHARCLVHAKLFLVGGPDLAGL